MGRKRLHGWKTPKTKGKLSFLRVLHPLLLVASLSFSPAGVFSSPSSSSASLGSFVLSLVIITLTTIIVVDIVVVIVV